MHIKSSIRAILLVLVLGLPAFADKYLLRLAPGVTATTISNQFASYGVKVTANLSGSGNGLCAVTVPDGALSSFVLQALRASGLVQSSEHDDPVGLPVKRTNTPASHPAVPNLPNQKKYLSYFGSTVWSSFLDQPVTGIIELNDAQKRASGVGVIAEIDTGVDPNHPALMGAITAGYDFTRNVVGGNETVDLNQDTTPILDQDTTPILDNDSTIVLNQDTTPILDQDTTPIIDNRLPVAYGHGTMVAGMIHLVAPTAKIMPLKAFDANGATTISQIVAAIYWAVDHGANVINMSFSTPQSSPELQNAVAFAIAHNVVCIASVGNDAQTNPVYPAAYDSVVGVASTTNDDRRSSFSDFGSFVNLAAPGEAVILPYPKNRYAMAWGTSFSAPQVAAAAALVRQIRPFMSVNGVTKALDHGDRVFANGMGSGRLDLKEMIEYLLD
jgi:subtilisin family serine protease